MKSFFNGHERLQFFFETPNQLAAFILICIFFLLALSTFIHSKRKKSKPPQTILCYTPAIIGIALISILLLTYSRGGYISFLICSSISLFLKPTRKITLIALVVFLTGLFTIPSGGERAIQTFPSSSDESISNRFKVWQGTLALISDHWTHGVGKYGFKNTYSMWYQDSTSMTRYGNAVNDSLDLAATRGVPMLALFLTTIAITTLLIFCAYRTKREAGFIFLFLSIFCYLICGLFSAFHFHPVIRWTFISIVAFSLIVSTVKIGKAVISVTFAKRLAGTVSISLVICMGILVSGSKLASQYESRVTKISSHQIDTNLNLIASTPRNIPLIGTAIFIPEQHNDIQTAKRTLKHLSKLGYLAISPKLSNRGLTGLNELEGFLDAVSNSQQLHKNTILVGHGSGGRLILVAASKNQTLNISRIVTIGAPAEWPFKALSPIEYIESITAKLSVLHGANDANVHISNASKLKEYADNHGVSIDVTIVDDAFHYLGDKWQNSLSKVLSDS